MSISYVKSTARISYVKAPVAQLPRTRRHVPVGARQGVTLATFVQRSSVKLGSENSTRLYHRGQRITIAVAAA